MIKTKRATRTRHAHAQLSIDPLAHLARSYLCPCAYGAEQTSK